MSGSIYVNFALLATGDVIGAISLTFAIKYSRRVLCMSACMFSVAILSFCQLAVAPDAAMTIAGLAMCGRFMITVLFNMTYAFTAELFPTPLRSSALGTGSMFSRFGGIAAPYVATLIEVWRPLPVIILGSCGIIGGVVLLFLPETFNKPLPGTIEEIEKSSKIESLPIKLVQKLFSSSSRKEPPIDFYGVLGSEFYRNPIDHAVLLKSYRTPIDCSLYMGLEYGGYVQLKQTLMDPVEYKKVYVVVLIICKQNFDNDTKEPELYLCEPLISVVHNVIKTYQKHVKRCSIPQCDDSPTKNHPAEWLNSAIPLKYDEKTEKRIPDNCHMYKYNLTSKSNETCDLDFFENSTIIKCQTFVYAEKYQTLTKEWDLTCDKRSRLVIGMSVYMAGFLVGVYLFGLISDRLNIFGSHCHNTPFVAKRSRDLLRSRIGIESPKWLISQKRYEDAKTAIKTFAKMQRQEVPESSLQTPEEEKDNNENVQKKLNPLDLFRTSNVRFRMILISIIWFFDSLIAYSIALGTKEMNGSIYTNFALVATGDLLAIVALTFAIKYFRRVLFMSACMFSVAIVSFCQLAIAPEAAMAIGGLALCGRFLITLTFNMTYAFTAELFPTPVRSSALGTGSMFSRVGGILAPYVATLIILEEMKDAGRAQVIFVMFAFWTQFVTCFNVYTQMFSQGDELYRCSIPGCDESPAKYQTEWLNSAIPQKYDKKTEMYILDNCHMHSYNVTSKSNGTCDFDVFENSTKVKCQTFVYASNYHTLTKEVMKIQINFLSMLLENKKSPPRYDTFPKTRSTTSVQKPLSNSNSPENQWRMKKLWALGLIDLRA
ncbi:Solute carrier family 22 member 4 [Nymphon striatum]|nr:Solute carrier family 22 member 4 [Nymphon striatum]